jgi:hypothetical protein
MRLRTVRRLRFWSQIFIAGSLLFIVISEYVRPFAVSWYYQDEYSRLALECDQSMHDEAALRAGTSGAAKDSTLEISGMVGLAVCHQYDVLRKRMLINGVSEEGLALIGLKGLENEQIPVSRMVDPHRMDRF